MNGLVQVCRVDQIETAQLFLRLGEWTVGSGDFALPDPHGRGGLRGLQRIAADVVAALLDSLSKSAVFSHHRVQLLFRQRSPLAFVVIDKA